MDFFTDHLIKIYLEMDTFLTILLLFYLSPANNACFPGLEHLQSQLRSLQQKLGGDIEVDLSLTSIPLIKYRNPAIPNPYISRACDLNCDAFDATGMVPCKWSNEMNKECEPFCGDQLDFIRAKNSWGREESMTIFGTDVTASRYYILAGTDKKQHPLGSAMLVSHPIACQEGDGQFAFRYWTSPGVYINVCTRRLGEGTKNFMWCSGNVTVGDPGPINLMIAGSIMVPFEIVIIARGFNFDAFGQTGGIVILDDLIYSAPSVQRCRNIPHFDPPPKLHHEACLMLNCGFEETEECTSHIKTSGFRRDPGVAPLGNLHTGIRTPYKASFAYVRGPGTKSMKIRNVNINRQVSLEFCLYAPSNGTDLVVKADIEGFNTTQLFSSENIDHSTHNWQCQRLVIHPALYKSLEFIGKKLPNQYSYLAIDGLKVFDPITGQDLCEQAPN
uniref:MAM domain-containing protein n=1 Tax=Rhabditophanes sp. KR3021 TaxID=114890 RepID=A0AC35UB10_9BILA